MRVLILVVTAVLALAGCGSGDSSNGAVAPASPEETKLRAVLAETTLAEDASDVKFAVGQDGKPGQLTFKLFGCSGTLARDPKPDREEYQLSVLGPDGKPLPNLNFSFPAGNLTVADTKPLRDAVNAGCKPQH